VRVVGLAKHNVVIVLASLDCPDPQERQWQPTNVLCQNSTVLTDRRRKFEREVSRAASQVDNCVSGLKIQCLKNLGRTLPLVPFRLNNVQTRKSVKPLVSGVDKEQNRNRTQKKED
jgi:hypothetical protein